MTDILDDLRDLHKQATTERSHHYVAATCLRAIKEIEDLRRQWLDGVTKVLAKVTENKRIIDEANARIDQAGRTWLITTIAKCLHYKENPPGGEHFMKWDDLSVLTQKMWRRDAEATLAADHVPAREYTF